MNRTHIYRPRGSAKELMENRAAEILLSGPAGTGKSRACLEKILACAIKYPGMKALILRKTLKSLSTTALDTWRKHVAVDHIETGEVVYYGGSSEEPAQYRFANGSKVMVGGMDNPTRIMSSEYDLIYVQEAIEFTVTDWENANSRLRNGIMPYQQLIADTNPSTPTHWLKLRCDDGACLMLHSRHEENPILFGDDGKLTARGIAYMARLDALTGVRKQRLRFGRWVASEGIIWEQWEPRLHVVPAFEPPHAWRRWWVIDFGFTNPFVLQCWAEDPDGRLILYREIYHTARTVDQHAETIMKIVLKNPVKRGPTLPWTGEWREPRPSAVICDHDAEGRVVWRRETGLVTVAAKKDVIDGIQAVDRRMRPRGDGRPGVELMEGVVVETDQSLRDRGRPVSTIEEIPGYVWDITAAAKIADKAPKETPRKEDDHGCDAMRYIVAHRDLRGQPGLRFME
jgi:phage terminase large subunit